MVTQLQLGFIEDFYDRYADHYGNLRTGQGMLFNDYIERPSFQKLLSECSPLKGKKILDVGCGPGIYARDMAGSGAKVDAIDISKKMLSLARDYCKASLKQEIFNSIDFQHVSFESYSGKKSSYDMIIATFMLSYFDNLDVFFRRSKYFLKRNGIIITSMLHPVRMSSYRTNDGYILSNYFDTGYYDSDFISHTDHLPLKKWTINAISQSASDAGLLLEKILEPKPINELPQEYEKEGEFYRTHPSVLLMKFRSR